MINLPDHANSWKVAIVEIYVSNLICEFTKGDSKKKKDNLYSEISSLNTWIYFLDIPYMKTNIDFV